MGFAIRSGLIVLGTSLALALSPVGADALAAPKKKVSVTKKHHAASKVRHGTPSRSAALADPPGAADEMRGVGIQSASASVVDQNSGAVLYEKNADSVVPIASISKLMTAMVVLDTEPDLDAVLTITDEDVDVLKGTRSHLRVGTQLSRENMLRLALMSSENRAAAALSRYYPGGREGFVAAMNRKATELGLNDTRFLDPTGLTAANVSNARDLTRMVAAAYQYPLIRSYTTTSDYTVSLAGRPRTFHNTNRLVSNSDWEIGLSKTGYINEAGKCLVMQAWLNSRPTIIVLLDSWGRLTRIGDAKRIRRWMESASLAPRIAG
jgi:D-alanyl-D-alanine endopeptidase (penicillin-binding protein 7)